MASSDNQKLSIPLTNVDGITCSNSWPTHSISAANISGVGLTVAGSQFNGSLTAIKADGTQIDVLNDLDSMDVRLAVISEVLDEIIMQTGLSSKASIQERVEQKLMIRRLSGQQIPRIN